jgi:sugar/nucleoside kinase (ribokinase family)
MVWDRIDHPDTPTVERWGGVAYSLAAATAVLPRGWTVRPLVKVGTDLAGAARSFLDTLPGLEWSGIVEVPEPTNRVHLRYRDSHHRNERLTGGVRPWRWPELAPHLSDLDGLYVNLISGFELDLPTAQDLRAAFDGPIYSDLHSLLLGMDDDGRRTPRTLPDREAWLDAFDVVQANETELELVAGDDEPGVVARDAVGRGLAAVLVTRGPFGADWYAVGDVSRPWDSAASRRAAASGTVPVPVPWPAGDPTGCGDVWGATCFVGLMDGRRLTDAMTEANVVASRNVDHQGAEGLYSHLRARR